jgi:hypothetical protein
MRMYICGVRRNLCGRRLFYHYKFFLATSYEQVILQLHLVSINGNHKEQSSVCDASQQYVIPSRFALQGLRLNRLCHRLICNSVSMSSHIITKYPKTTLVTAEEAARVTSGLKMSMVAGTSNRMSSTRHCSPDSASSLLTATAKQHRYLLHPGNGSVTDSRIILRPSASAMGT